MNTLLLSLVVVVTFISSGDAIMCFVCNSGELYDEKHVCGSIADMNLEKVPNEYKVNCSMLPPREGLPYSRCRTMVQDVEGEERIVRSCATYPDTSKTNRCIDRTGTAKIKLRYCECDDKDYCNAATIVGGSTVFATILLILSAFFCSHMHI